MRVEEYMESEVAEQVRSHLKEALDKCNLPYQFKKDRLLADFTKEVCLAMV